MNEKLILKNENVKIIRENYTFKIEFKFPACSLINSLIKTHIIRGASTNETYQKIVFNANSVKTFEEYKNNNMKIYGKQIFSILDVVNLLCSLTIQLNYLIIKEMQTIIGYNSSDIIVINDKMFVFLGNELLSNIEDNGNTTISYPFLTKDFFVSPELLKIKELPSKVHYKTAYFSLGLLLIYSLSDNDDFYKDYLIHKESKKVLELLNNHSIKNTRIYWLLSRCLVEDSKKRSIIFI